MKVQAIIPAAGSGERFGSQLPKPLVLLKGKPILIYVLDSFKECFSIDSIIVVINEGFSKEFKAALKENDLAVCTKMVNGGSKRHQSVFNGLQAVDNDTDFIVIHDGARPLVTSKLIEETVRLGLEHDAAISAVPCKPTVKRVDPCTMFVEATLDRKLLWDVQTPQVFRKDLIVKAHQQNKDEDPTDDASMVEKLGVKVKVIMGDHRNIKITTKEDLVIAEKFLETQ